MKRFCALILCVLMTALAFVGCAASGGGKADGKLNVVATVFPVYDWLRELTKGVDNIELTLLLDDGADLHSYQPTADDMIKISTCDLFVCVGGESDSWTEDALKEVVNKDMISINLMDSLESELYKEEVVEGMESDEDESGEDEYDEHIWLSLKKAGLNCKTITDALIKLDPDNAAKYSSNRDDYISRLKSLDDEYSEAVSAAKYKTLLFGDRFPFRYLTEDYGLKYYAAFVGCSAETEASFETVLFLSNKLKELNLPAVLTLEKSDQKLANTIISTAGTKNTQILTLNSMQSLTSREASDGTTYLAVMSDNLEVLKKAIN